MIGLAALLVHTLPLVVVEVVPVRMADELEMADIWAVIACFANRLALVAAVVATDWSLVSSVLAVVMLISSVQVRANRSPTKITQMNTIN